MVATRGDQSDASAQAEKRQDGDNDDDCSDEVDDAVHEIFPFARVEGIKGANRVSESIHDTRVSLVSFLARNLCTLARIEHILPYTIFRLDFFLPYRASSSSRSLGNRS
jgi:hypothetical protein